MKTSCWSLVAVASLALTATVLPTTSALPLRNSMTKQLKEAKKGGASKTELKALKIKIKDEMMTAKAAGVSTDVSTSALLSEISLNDMN